MILADPRHEPKVRQGVTTEVIGVDGNGYAPFRSREELVRFARSTPAWTGPGLAYDWTDMASYLALFDGG